MRVNKLRISPDGAQVQIEGLEGEFFSMVQEGIQLQDGTRLQLDAYSPENHSVELNPVHY